MKIHPNFIMAALRIAGFLQSKQKNGNGCPEGCLVGGFSPTHLKNMRTVKLDHLSKVQGENIKYFKHFQTTTVRCVFFGMEM